MRVPLSVLIDYKGFRCLAIGKIPILPKQGPSIGFHNGVYVPIDPELKNLFANVGDVLHLKDNKVASAQNTMFQQVPVSYFTKIYTFSQASNDMKMKKELTEPQKQSLKFHFNELEYMERPNYVLNTSEIFPLDSEQLDPKNIRKNPNCVFRPEFFCNYQQFLQADTMKEFQGLQLGFKPNYFEALGTNKDVQDLSDASKFLKNQVLYQVVEILDNLQTIPIDSDSLTDFLHSHGVNMRYLSHVAVISNVPHIIEICVNEMLARTCKNILNEKLSELVVDNKVEYDQLEEAKRLKSRELKEA